MGIKTDTRSWTANYPVSSNALKPVITTGSSVLHAPEREREVCVSVCFKLADESFCELNESPSPLGYGYMVWEKTDLTHYNPSQNFSCVIQDVPLHFHIAFLLALRGPLLAVKMTLSLPHCHQNAQVCILQHQAFTFTLLFVFFFLLASTSHHSKFS